MEPSGEHFSPLKTILPEIELNLDRYLFAMPFIQGKTVLDIGCGCGLGTFFYSMLATKVYALDYSMEALDYARKFPFAQGKVEFIHFDVESRIDTDKLPEVDVCVALEVLEHLEEPSRILKNVRCKRLVFSVPLHSMEMSSYHKYEINTVDDVKKMITAGGFEINKIAEQKHTKTAGTWVFGEAVRIIQ